MIYDIRRNCIVNRIISSQTSPSNSFFWLRYDNIRVPYSTYLFLPPKNPPLTLQLSIALSPSIKGIRRSPLTQNEGTNVTIPVMYFVLGIILIILPQKKDAPKTPLGRSGLTVFLKFVIVCPKNPGPKLLHRSKFVGQS